MEFIFSILAFLLVLTPVVFFHELGHFWAARRSGVVVEVFSVGFGAELFGMTDRHGTRWKFSAIPLGGYVKMAGDSDAASTPSQDAKAEEGNFHAASLGAKTFIVAMGPIANFILGIGIIAMIYIGFGKVIVPNIVADVIDGGAAIEAGIEPGDRIVSIDGRSIDDFNDLRGVIFENPNRNLPITIERGSEQHDLFITPLSIDDKCLGITYGQIGITSPQGELRTYGVVDATMLASVDSFHMSIAMLRGLGRLVTGNANKGEIGGPVRIAEISGRVASQGVMSLLFFVAVISINLGLVNLLPVPALDGGHLMFFGLEKLAGRPLNPKIQEWLMKIGIFLLISLIIIITFYDILGNVTREC